MLRVRVEKKEMGAMKQPVLLLSFVVLMAMATSTSQGAVPISILNRVMRINKEGPYFGVAVPNAFEMSPLLQSPSYVENEGLPYLDFGGRRFRFATIGKEKVIVVMTGLGMLNAGLSTQLLLSLFRVKGIVHFGVAGNANPDLQIGDVTIPQFWAHTGLWNWQRYGDGPDDELPFESAGDCSRKIGYLNISDYDVDKDGKVSGNYLNNVWYQPEEIFPVNGVPEVREHAFWVSVAKDYYKLSQKLEGMKLKRCVNATTCLKRSPIVTRVKTGCSASIFVDNAAYRQFLRSQFGVAPIEMESAAVALVSRQQRTPFIIIRSLSDLAGGGSSKSNEASTFAPLAAQNAADVAVAFISLAADLSHATL